MPVFSKALKSAFYCPTRLGVRGLVTAFDFLGIRADDQSGDKSPHSKGVSDISGEESTKLAEQFDVVIIGSGPGGYVAAIRAGQLGLKAAIVEKDNRLGGTCTLRGCIPTKQMLMSAHIYEQMQHAADFGVQASGIQLAFADVQKRKDKVVLKNVKGIEYLMKKNKVTVVKGTGKLALPGKVEVTDAEGKKQTLQTKNVIIATGSVVRPIPGFETDGKQVVNSDHILELKDVPKSLIVMGAGAVGVELASVYSRF